MRKEKFDEYGKKLHFDLKIINNLHAKPAHPNRILIWIPNNLKGIQKTTTPTLSIALPPEGNTLVGGGAQEHIAGTVGHTGQPVAAQHKVLRTGAGALQQAALLLRPGPQQAEGVAAPVILAGVVGGGGLTQRVIHLQIHGPVYGGEDGLLLLTAVPVAPLDRLRLPVRPVEVVLEHAHREDVMEPGGGIASARNHLAHPRAVQVAHGDVVFARVPKEKLVGVEGDGERVGPAQVFGDDERLGAAVERCAADVGPVAPVRPVEVAV